MQQCSNEAKQQSSDAAVQQCSNAAMQQSSDAAMQRCSNADVVTVPPAHMALWYASCMHSAATTHTQCACSCQMLSFGEDSPYYGTPAAGHPRPQAHTLVHPHIWFEGCVKKSRDHTAQQLNDSCISRTSQGRSYAYTLSLCTARRAECAPKARERPQSLPHQPFWQ